MSTTRIDTLDSGTKTPLGMRLAFALSISLMCLGAYKTFAAPGAEAGRVQTLTQDSAGIGTAETRLTPIEEIELGTRVLADSPTEDFDRDLGLSVSPATWSRLDLTVQKDDGGKSEVALLRPSWWISTRNVRAGHQFPLSIPDCGINGPAFVNRISACPQIADGAGEVVTGTFLHNTSLRIDLQFDGTSETIACTPNHRFWSEDRQIFVTADDLREGEHLRTATGHCSLAGKVVSQSTGPVYNLEVFGSHVYHVGTSGILTHNGCAKYSVYVLRSKSGKTKYWGITRQDPYQRMRQHARDKTKDFVDMRVVSTDLTYRQARNVEGSALKWADGKGLQNARRQDGQFYHSYPDSPTKGVLLSEDYINSLLHKAFLPFDKIYVK